MNRKTVLFVDGYNIINAWPELKGSLDEDLEGARDKLNNYMFEYASFYGEDVYIVYDAYLTDSKKEKIEVINGVTIVYTKENQTADTYIERKVNELSEDVRIMIKVVTSDWVQQRQILGSGGIRLTPFELKDKCVRIRRKIKWNLEKKKSENRTFGHRSFKKLENLLNNDQK